MNAIKKAIIILGFIISVSLLMYALGCVVNASFDLTRWGQDSRNVVALFTGVIWFCGGGPLISFLLMDETK